MEAFFDQVFLLLSGFADKYQWLSYVMMVVGGNITVDKGVKAIWYAAGQGA